MSRSPPPVRRSNGRPACALVGLLGLLLVAGCGKEKNGPIVVSAIGAAPSLANPSAMQPDTPSALLAEATAQGLVRFEASGQIEPGLAHRWIVSDDGLRYTFRLGRAQWDGDGKVTAAQVVARLRAAAGSSRNRLKPVLGAIDDIQAMTEDVLEIDLKHPSQYFLELLAQPDLAIIHSGRGSGPFRATPAPDGGILLRQPREEAEEDNQAPFVLLGGERSAMAVARFRAGRADFVTGGTAGDLPIARVAGLPGGTLRYDPVAGLFGLQFTSRRGPLARSDVRQALAMAIDRGALVAAIGIPDLLPRESLLPPGLDELATPALPSWGAQTMTVRRSAAARLIRGASRGTPLTLKVALPAQPGYRLLFAYLQRDWREIGVTVSAVPPDAAADLRLVDEVAPAVMPSWYLRSLSCERTQVCDPKADAMMDAARTAPTAQLRRQMLAAADGLLAQDGFFIAFAAPVRWHLVSARLNGFRPNAFGQHPLDELVVGGDGGNGGESGQSF